MSRRRDPSVGPSWAAIAEPDRASTTSATTSTRDFDDEDDELISAPPSQRIPSMKRKRSPKPPSPGTRRPTQKRASASQAARAQTLQLSSSDEDELPRYISQFVPNPNIYPLPQGVTRLPPTKRRRRINVETLKAASANAPLPGKGKGKHPLGRPSRSGLRLPSRHFKTSKTGPESGQEVIEISDDDEPPVRGGPSQGFRATSNQCDAPPIDLSSEGSTPPSTRRSVNLAQQSSPVMVSAGPSSRLGMRATGGGRQPLPLAFGNAIRKLESVSPRKSAGSGRGPNGADDGGRTGTQTRPIELDLSSDEEPSFPIVSEPRPPSPYPLSMESPPAFSPPAFSPPPSPPPDFDQSPGYLIHDSPPQFPVDRFADSDSQQTFGAQEENLPRFPVTENHGLPAPDVLSTAVFAHHSPSPERVDPLISPSALFVRSVSPVHSQEDDGLPDPSTDLQVHNAESAEPPLFSSPRLSPSRRTQTPSLTSAAAIIETPLVSSLSPAIAKLSSAPPASQSPSQSPSPPAPYIQPQLLQATAEQTSSVVRPPVQDTRASDSASESTKTVNPSHLAISPPPVATSSALKEAAPDIRHQSTTPVRTSVPVSGAASPNMSLSPFSGVDNKPSPPLSRRSHSSPSGRRKLRARFAGPDGLFKHVHMGIKKKIQASRESTALSEQPSTSFPANDTEDQFVSERMDAAMQDTAAVESRAGPSPPIASLEPRPGMTPLSTVAIPTPQVHVAGDAEIPVDPATTAPSSETSVEEGPLLPISSKTIIAPGSSTVKVSEELRSVNGVERPEEPVPVTPSQSDRPSESESPASPTAPLTQKSMKGKTSADIIKHIQFKRKQYNSPRQSLKIQSQQRLKELHNVHFDLTQDDNELPPEVSTREAFSHPVDIGYAPTTDTVSSSVPDQGSSDGQQETSVVSATGTLSIQQEQQETAATASQADISVVVNVEARGVKRKSSAILEDIRNMRRTFPSSVIKPASKSSPTPDTRASSISATSIVDSHIAQAPEVASSVELAGPSTAREESSSSLLAVSATVMTTSVQVTTATSPSSVVAPATREPNLTPEDPPAVSSTEVEILISPETVMEGSIGDDEDVDLMLQYPDSSSTTDPETPDTTRLRRSRRSRRSTSSASAPQPVTRPKRTKGKARSDSTPELIPDVSDFSSPSPPATPTEFDPHCGKFIKGPFNDKLVNGRWIIENTPVRLLHDNPLKVYYAKNLPHRLQDRMNSLDPEYRKNENAREVFEAMIRHNTIEDEPDAPPITIVNDIDLESTPPWEFHYSNHMWLAEGVPAPNLENLRGCSCRGRCDPKSPDCACVKRQMQVLQKGDRVGLLYDNNRRLKRHGYPIFECNELCGCLEDCPNRVVQRGRQHAVSIKKTEWKGWGVFAGRKKIPKDSFIGIYSGELLANFESQMRGEIYNKCNKTYLFDIDFYFTPREGRFTVDAYHVGNFTRFLNHSCDPNCKLNAVFINEPDVRKALLTIWTVKDVMPEDELTFCYHGDDDDEKKEKKEKEPEEKEEKKEEEEEEATNSEDPIYMNCLCGAPNCKGKMFKCL